MLKCLYTFSIRCHVHCSQSVRSKACLRLLGPERYSSVQGRGTWGKAYEVWSRVWTVERAALSVAEGWRASQKEATGWRGWRGRERTGEDGRGEDLTVMESTAERGDGLREDKATFLKSYFLPRSLSWWHLSFKRGLKCMSSRRRHQSKWAGPVHRQKTTTSWFLQT